MASATVTIRELKNKDTGIDLSVPSFKEIPGFLTSTGEYHVVVISRLNCFKSPKHKEKDNVQFQTVKNYSHFEILHKKLTTRFSGTLIAPFPKKVLNENTSVIKERRHLFDDILKFIASSSKLATCPEVLEFLGVSPMKAQNFKEVVGSESEKNKKDSNKITIKTESDNLFGVEEDTNDLFSTATNAHQEADELFSSSVQEIKAEEKQTKLFEDQDYGGTVEEDDADLFILKDAKITTAKIEIEDNSDLLNIDDDFESLLKLNSKKLNTTLQNTPNAGPKPETKPVLAPKPGKKPSLAPKPGQKPSLAPKPVQKADEKNKQDGKGDCDQMENSARKTEDLNDLFAEPPSTTGNDFDADDILKYIQDNTSKSDDDLDLFS